MEIDKVEFENNLKKAQEYKQKFARYNRRRKAFFRWYLKTFHRLEVSGLENIPEGPALIATNHSGGFDLDIVTLSDCCHPTRPIHSLIAKPWHYFYHWWGRYWVGGGIPLWTQGGIRWEYIDPYLDKTGSEYPGLVAIYPEGHSGTFKTRRVLHKFFPGVVRIALGYRVPIVPVAMTGFHKAVPILAEIERDHGPNDIIFLPFTFPFKLRVEFGPAFELTEFYGKQLSRTEEFRVANDVVRPKIVELLEKRQKVVLEEFR